MQIPDHIQTIEELKHFLNLFISETEARLRGPLKLTAPLNFNGFPGVNLPSPQRNQNDAITMSELGSFSSKNHSEESSLLWAFFLS